MPNDDRLPTPDEILVIHEEIEEAEDVKYRGARAVARVYLGRYGLQPAERDVSVERVLRRIRRDDVEEIAHWLESGNRDRLRP